MRAIAVDHLGDEPTLRDLPDPEPGPGEMRLRVLAAGINPLDWKAAGGMLDDVGARYRTPLVLGFDVAGRVEQVGDGVEQFSVGDVVFGLVWPETLGHGTYAETTVVPASAALARLPEALSFEMAAMLPMPGGTALRLVDDLGIGEGQTVAVVGAAGAVGTYAVQLASQAGAQVIGVAGRLDRSRLQEHGAGRFVDRSDPDVAASLRAIAPDGVDAVIDVASDAEAVSALAAAVRPGGHYVSLVGSADVGALAARDVQAENSFYRAASEDAERLADLVVEGRLQLPPRHVVSLDEAVDALGALQRGERKGKFVIVPEPA
ncbi:MAG: NADP-dependent oxidoreductase [Acidimicrobiales bacterium]